MTSTKIQNRTPTGPSHARSNQLWKSTSICTALAQVFHREHRCRAGAGNAVLSRNSGSSRANHSIGLACCLTGAELRERRATLLAQFRSGVIETEELPDGHAFRLPGDCRWVAIRAEMILAERECCPFLTFELLAKAGMGQSQSA